MTALDARSFIWVCASILTLGCAATGTEWQHPWNSAEQRERDQSECLAYAGTAQTGPDVQMTDNLAQAFDMTGRSTDTRSAQRVYARCMGARGYYRSSS
jgi:hypothetical protein